MGQFWFRVLAALSRAAAAWIFAEVGIFVDEAIVARFPKEDGWPEARILVHGIAAVVLIVLDVYLAWDTVCVFIPRLKGKRQ